MKIIVVGGDGRGELSIAKRILEERGRLSEEERIKREESLKKEWKENFRPLSINILTMDLPSRRR